MALNVAVLIKQVPKFESLNLGANGRLDRSGSDLEINPFCRRAITKGVELAAADQGKCTIFTLGPASAEDCLREALAWGADEGVLVTGTEFAGSDTLATAKTLVAAMNQVGSFDLVLVGRNSVDGDTGQVGPEVAELLGCTFVPSVRDMTLIGAHLCVRCELDEGWSVAETDLPCVVSVAERLCDPAKVERDLRERVSRDRIRVLTSDDLGPGPWGVAASRTVVGVVRPAQVSRQGVILEGPTSMTVREAVTVLRDWEVCRDGDSESLQDGRIRLVADGHNVDSKSIVVIAEPGRPETCRELLGKAAELASEAGFHVELITVDDAPETGLAGRWGADKVLRLDGVFVQEDIALLVADWCDEEEPWIVLAPSTSWGREVASRIAARTSSGLVGDTIDLEVKDGHLVAWKPALSGGLVAAISVTSPIQLATVRPGVFPPPHERAMRYVPVTRLSGASRNRMAYLESTREDDFGRLTVADVVIGVGAGVDPEAYPAIHRFAEFIHAEVAASRRVTDKGWIPHSRQIGITGRSISPSLYIAVGISGKFNHMVGVRSARCILAVNRDREAPIFEYSDIGIVGDWQEVVEALTAELSRAESSLEWKRQ